MNNIDLFSGIGAWRHAGNIVSILFDYLSLYYIPTVSVEIDDFVNNIREAKFSTVVYRDIRDYDLVLSDLNFLYMSFPCHGTSQRGKREGLANVNSSLFWEGLRIVKISKPRFIIIEQPQGIVSNGLDVIVKEVENIGYKTAVVMLSARAFGLPQRRNRVFIIASDSYDLQRIVYSQSGWTDSFRATFETVRSYALRSQVESGFCEKVNGVYRLSKDYCADCGVENYEGRYLEINAYARSIVPYCAAVPLAFLVGLDDCI